MLFVRQLMGFFIAYVAAIILLPLVIISAASYFTSEVQQHLALSAAMKPPSRAVAEPKLMDEAEAHAPSVKPATVARAAGWIKRANPQPALKSDSPGRIVERSLRADF